MMLMPNRTGGDLQEPPDQVADHAQPTPPSMVSARR